MYQSEDIIVPDLQINDNQDVLDLIIGKPKGIIAMLDEEGVVPRGSVEGFLSKLKKTHAAHKRIKFKPGAALDFTVSHFAGAVNYDPGLFILKNKDTLSADLSEVMCCSTLPFISELFPVGTSAAHNKQTVGSRFRQQLQSLVDSLDTTEPHYIRCIKSNHEKKSDLFTADMVEEQLLYSGVFDAVVIMQNGYPFRLLHDHFLGRYHCLIRDAGLHATLYTDEMNADPRGRSRSLVAYAGSLWQSPLMAQCHSGVTKVFYRAEQHRIWEHCRKLIVTLSATIIQKCARRYIMANVVKGVLNSVKNCEALLGVTADTQSMKESTDSLHEMCGRLELVSEFKGPLDIEGILTEYRNALEHLSASSSTLQALLNDKEHRFEEFDEIIRLMNEVKTIRVNVSYHGQAIVANWEMDPHLVDANDTVMMMGKALETEKDLCDGLAEGDDMKIDKALREMARYSKDGIVEPNFSADNVAAGRRMAEESAKFFNEALDSFDAAMKTGHVVVTHTDCKNALACTVDCSHGELDKVVAQYSSASCVKIVSKSKKLQSLMVICKELSSLRRKVLKSKWADVLSDVTRWSVYLGENNDAPTPIQYIDEVAAFLRTEISSVISASAYCLDFLPYYDKNMKLFELPEVCGLGYRSDAAFSDTVELMSFVHKLEVHEHHFDAKMKNLVDIAKERITLYDCGVKLGDDAIDEVCVESWNKIISHMSNVVRGLKETCNDDCNYKIVWEMLTLRKRKTDIMDAFLTGKSTGVAGNLVFDSDSCNSLHAEVLKLQDCVNAGQFSESINPSWWSCFVCYRAVSNLRSVLARYVVDRGANATKVFLLKLSEMVEQWEVDKESLRWTKSQDACSSFVMIALGEMDYLVREAKHIIASNKIIALLQCDQISGEIGNVDTSMCAVKDLETCFEKFKNDLIVYETDKADSCRSLIQGCGYLIKLRSAVLNGDWDSIIKLFEDQIVVETANLSSVHWSCSNELHLFYGEVADRQTRRSLVEVLEKYPLISYYSLENPSDSGDLDLYWEARDVMLRDLETIKVILEAAEVVSEKSFELVHLLTSVKTVLLMRYLLAGSTRWGITSYTSEVQDMQDLSSAVNEQAKLLCSHGESVLLENFGGDIIHIIANDHAAIDYSSINCEEMSVASVLSLVDTVNIEAILCYFYDCIGIAPEVSVDVKFVYRLLLNRKAHLVLLLSLHIGCISGDVNNLSVTNVDTKFMLDAIAYLNLNFASACGGYFVPYVTSLFQSCQVLFNIRVAVLSIKNAHVAENGPVDYGQLSHYFGVFRLECALKVVPFSLELKLIIDFLNNFNSCQSLLQMVSSGAACYYGGHFDKSFVQFSHVAEALVSAHDNNNSPASEILNWLLLYCELCVSLRKFILDCRWESGNDVKDAELDNRMVKQGIAFYVAVNDVSTCIHRFQKAQNICQNPRCNPPSCLVNEFHVATMELQRMRIVEGFRVAFSSDGVEEGHDSQLVLRNVCYSRLQQLVKQSEEWKSALAKYLREIGEIETYNDAELESCCMVANDLIEVLKCVTAIQESYKSKCSEASIEISGRNSAVDVLRNMASSLVDQAVDLCIQRNDSLLVRPYIAESEWSPVSATLSRMGSSVTHRSCYFQMELLLTESFRRQFVSKSVSILHDIASLFSYHEKMTDSGTAENVAMIRLSPDNLVRFVNDIADAVLSFLSFLGRSSSGRVKLGRHVEILRHSLVFLYHLAIANLNNHHDAVVDRDWLVLVEPSIKLDEFNCRPTMNQVVLNFAAGAGKENGESSWESLFSIQTLLRYGTRNSSTLHGIVNKLVAGMCCDIEDLVSFCELSSGLHAGKLVGVVGHVTGKTNDGSLLRALNRVLLPTEVEILKNHSYCKNRGMNDSSLQCLIISCVLIYHLRKCCVDSNYAEGIRHLYNYVVIHCGETDVGELKSTIDTTDTPLSMQSVAKLFDFVHHGRLTVYSAAVEEALLLSFDICDGYWNILAKRSLVENGRLEGKLLTGNNDYCDVLNITEVSCSDIDSVLNLEARCPATIGLANSDDTLVMTKLLRNVKALRGYFLSVFCEQIAGVTGPCADIDAVVTQGSRISISKSTVSALCSSVSTCLETIRSRLSQETALSVSNECIVADKYSSYALVVEQLVAIGDKSILSLGNIGMSVNSALLQAYDNCIAKLEPMFGNFNFDSCPSRLSDQINWWYMQCLELLSCSRDMFCVALAAAGCELIHPEQGCWEDPDMMKHMLRYIQIVDSMQSLFEEGNDNNASVVLYSSTVLDIVKPSVLKFGPVFHIPAGAVENCRELKQFVEESDRICRFNEIIKAPYYCLKLLQKQSESPNCQGLVSENMTGICMLDCAVSLVDDYREILERDCAYVDCVHLKTAYGNQLQQVVKWHISARKSIVGRQYYDAQCIVSLLRKHREGADCTEEVKNEKYRLHLLPKEAPYVLCTFNISEMDAISKFCLLVSVKRSLEFNLSHCLFPGVIGWSVDRTFNSAFDPGVFNTNPSISPSLIALSIEDGPVIDAIDYCDVSLDSGDIEGNSAIGELSTLAHIIVAVVAAIRRGEWARFADVYLGNSTNVNNGIDEESVAALLHPVVEGAPMIDSMKTMCVEELLNAIMTSLDKCSYISDYVRLFCQNMVSTLDNEIQCLRLHKRITSVALCLPAEIACENGASVLTPNASRNDEIKQILEYMETEGVVDLVQRCYVLLQGYHCLKLLNSLYDAYAKSAAEVTVLLENPSKYIERHYGTSFHMHHVLVTLKMCLGAASNLLIHSECYIDIVDVRKSLYLSNAKILPIVGEYFGDVLNDISNECVRDRFKIVNNSATKFLKLKNFAIAKSDSCSLENELAAALGYDTCLPDWPDNSITKLSCHLVEYSEIQMMQRMFEYHCGVHEFFYCSSLKYLSGVCGEFSISAVDLETLVSSQEMLCGTFERLSVLVDSDLPDEDCVTLLSASVKVLIDIRRLMMKSQLELKAVYPDLLAMAVTMEKFDVSWSGNCNLTGSTFIMQCWPEMMSIFLDIEQKHYISLYDTAITKFRLPVRYHINKHSLMRCSLDSLSELVMDCSNWELGREGIQSMLPAPLQSTPVCCPTYCLLQSVCKLYTSLKSGILEEAWMETVEIVNDYCSKLPLLFPEHTPYACGNYINEVLLDEMERSKSICFSCYFEKLAISALQNGYDVVLGCYTDSSADMAARTDMSILPIDNRENVALKSLVGLFPTAPDIVWTNNEVVELRNTCELLYSLRLNASEGNWLEVIDSANKALHPVCLEVRPLHATIGFAEIKACRDIGVFIMANRILTYALSNNSYKCSAGVVDITSVSAFLVWSAYKCAECLLNMCESVKLRLLLTNYIDHSKLMYKLRTAILAGVWRTGDPIDGNFIEDRICMFSMNSREDCIDLTAGCRDTSSYQRVINKLLCVSNDEPNAKSSDTWLFSDVVFADADLLHSDYSQPPGSDVVSAEEVLNAISAGLMENNVKVSISEAEIQAARDQVLYSDLFDKLLFAMDTPGVKGEPGNLNTDNVETNPLENVVTCISSGKYDSVLGATESMVGMVRDAKFLLNARKLRLAVDWQSLSKLFKISPLGTKPETRDSKSDCGEQSVLQRVWSEGMLLKSDTLFQFYWEEFKAIAKKSLSCKAIKSNNALLTLNSIVSTLQRLLIDTLDASQWWQKAGFVCTRTRSKTDFDRLIEAERVALDLMIYKRHHTYQSPKNIMQRILDISAKDAVHYPESVSYVEVLLEEVHLTLRTCNKEEYIAILEKEIIEGQLYVLSPVGHINVDDISVQSLESALSSLRDVLQTSGTPREKEILMVGDCVFSVRKHIKEQLWQKVCVDLSNYNKYVLPSLTIAYYPNMIKDEIERVAIEAENFGACEVLRKALHNGRITDIFTLAAMFSRGELQQPKKNRARASFAGSDMLANEAHLRSLGVAIEKAKAMVYRSAHTDNLMKTGIYIHELRVCIHNGRWKEVEALVRDINGNTVVTGLLESNMPKDSLEEVGVARAGLSCRRYLSSLASSLMTGRVSGKLGHALYNKVEYESIQSTLLEMESLGLDDFVLSLVSEFSLFVCNIRRAINDSRWFEEGESDCSDVESSCSSSTVNDEITMDRLAALPVESIINIFATRKEYLWETLKSVLVEKNSILTENSGHGTKNSQQMGGRSSVLMLSSKSGGKKDSSEESEYWPAISTAFAEIDLISQEVIDKKARQILVAELEYDIRDELSEDGMPLNHTEKREKSIAMTESLQNAIDHVDEISRNGREGTLNLSVITRQLLTSAKLVLQFRRCIQSSDVENFKSLVDHTSVLIVQSNKLESVSNPDMLSLQYGIRELHHYLSLSTTSSFAISEFKNLVSVGNVRGPLDDIDVDMIETYGLQLWIDSVKALVSDDDGEEMLSVGSVKQMLSDAELLMAARKFVKTSDMLELYEMLIRNSILVFSDPPNVNLDCVRVQSLHSGCKEEMKHIAMLALYEEGCRLFCMLLSDIKFEGKLFSNREAFRNILTKQRLHDLLRSAIMLNAVRRYKPDSSCVRNKTHSNSRSYAVDENKYCHILSCDFNEFELFCNCCDATVKLWTAIFYGNAVSDSEADVAWEVGKVAGGNVHDFPDSPTDPLLSQFFFHYVVLHEASNRMSDVHKHLLQLDFKNSLSRIIAAEGVPAFDGGNGLITRNIGKHIRASLYNPNGTVPLVSVATDIPVVARMPLSTSSKRNSRRASRVSVSFSPLDTPGSGSRSSAERIHPKGSRRSSIGGLAAQRASAKKTGPLLKMQNSGLPEFPKPSVTVAHILCDTDWSDFPEDSQEQFNVVRNIFIDKVVRYRIQMCCTTNAVSMNSAGEIVISDESTSLLQQSLEEAKHIMERSRHLKASLTEWDHTTQYWIRTGSFFETCRRLLIEGDKEEFVTVLKRNGYLGSYFVNDEDFSMRKIKQEVYSETQLSSTGVSSHVSAAYSSCNEEYSLLEKHGWECNAEIIIRQSIEYMGSLAAEFDKNNSVDEGVQPRVSRRRSSANSYVIERRSSLVSPSETSNVLEKLLKLYTVLPFAQRSTTHYYKALTDVAKLLRKAIVLTSSVSCTAVDQIDSNSHMSELTYSADSIENPLSFSGHGDGGSTLTCMRHEHTEQLRKCEGEIISCIVLYNNSIVCTGSSISEAMDENIDESRNPMMEWIPLLDRIFQVYYSYGRK